MQEVVNTTTRSQIRIDEVKDVPAHMLIVCIKKQPAESSPSKTPKPLLLVHLGDSYQWAPIERCLLGDIPLNEIKHPTIQDAIKDMMCTPNNRVFICDDLSELCQVILEEVYNY